MEASLCDKNICLVLLVGLPGSGKTYLTNFLVNYFTVNEFVNEKYFSDLCVIPISYDDYMCYNDSDLKDWKEKRKNIFISVEKLISFYKGYKTELTDKLFINNYIDDNKSNILIIIDDNMYYKSMRYEYFQLARKHRISYCQICLETTLDKALDYNNKRDIVSVVPEHVIERMYNLIEIPDTNNNWENNSLIVPAFIDFNDSFILQKICHIIKDSLQSPIEVINDSENRDENRNITKTHLIHQLDIKLRSLIGNYIKLLKSSGKDVTNVARTLNNNRLKIIKDVKSGSLILPFEIITILQSPSKTNKDDEFVNNYFVNIITK